MRAGLAVSQPCVFSCPTLRDRPSLDVSHRGQSVGQAQTSAFPTNGHSKPSFTTATSAAGGRAVDASCASPRFPPCDASVILVQRSSRSGSTAPDDRERRPASLL